MDDFQGAGVMIARARAFFPFLYSSGDPSVPELYDVYNLHDDKVAAPAVFIVDKGGRITYRYVGKIIADRAPTDEILEELARLER